MNYRLSSKKQTFAATLVILLLVISTTILFLFVSPIHQNPAYHDFAPTTLERTKIPNTFNVITNIPFAIVGLLGLAYCAKFLPGPILWSWRVFFSGVALTSIGSAYYHWQPNNATLVWDRLPMTIAFTALFIALLSERLNTKLEHYFLIPMIVVGISSVLYWQYTDDLRAYGLIQFFPLVALPLIIAIIPGRYDLGYYLFYGLAFYLAAKLFEAYDHEAWQLIGFSGHAIKHLLAACSTLSILLMLKKRKIITYGSRIMISPK